MTSTFSVNIENVHVHPWGCEFFADCLFLDGRKLSPLFDLGILDQRNVRKLLGRQISVKEC